MLCSWPIWKFGTAEQKEKYLKPIPVGVIDWDNMVIIKINNSLGTKYYMPVKNSDDFIKEVNKLRNINIT